jgi:phospholipid/cholesterol/gamma-HCH transport system substrate-binding protein
MDRGRAPRKRTPMDRDANYFAVGAFVLLVIAMGVSFVFWYTDQQDRHSYQRYEIYFNGSVSGLTAGSPVRYLGVDVGKVFRIMIDPQQRNRVQVIADIETSAPIDSRTRASLSLQGITGLLFIDLEQDPKVHSTAELVQGLHYPVIVSGQSNIEALLSSLPDLTEHTVELVNRFNQVFSDDNVKAITETLDNARQASARLPNTLRDLQELVTDVRHTMQGVQGATVDLRAVITEATPGVEAAVGNIQKISDNLERTSERLDGFVAENQPGLSRFTKQSLPELEQLLRESRQAAREFRDLSRSLKANPSQLIYESAYHGVEVPP